MKFVLTLISLVVVSNIYCQEISYKRVIPTEELQYYLKDVVNKNFPSGHPLSNELLAEYLRKAFSERYFFDWRSFEDRFLQYQNLYSEREAYHKSKAEEHMSKFPAETNWILPFNDRSGNLVDAYTFRHLARQHKMVDIAFTYFYQDKDPRFLDYFIKQQASLNEALKTNKYETSDTGNGVYEGLRSGYRILNWLQVHNMFLGEPLYTVRDQLATISTLLQTAAELYKSNPEFVPGNHQTRGMSALVMVSILLRDFKGTDKWYEHAMALLEQHMKEEINSDGFQFERSVHYHLSDIENYFYVYSLALRSNLVLGERWHQTMKSLLHTPIKLAYPDGTAPVLQDDTDYPWAERNIISGFAALGYILFDDPMLGYFASNQLDHELYWFADRVQLEKLGNIERQKPDIASVSFPETGYYIMRDGWEDHSKVMVITAGLDDIKPDHQHGDMLGIQAWANGNVILPNYQVRYSLKDFDLFKNSLVKNVGVVDRELQGKNWLTNKGNSGFGKFGRLPNPEIQSWSTDDQTDVFVGSHDGFADSGVTYCRQVIFLKKDFWIIKDNFSSHAVHDYKQIWQGHYTVEGGPNHLIASFANGSGLSLVQLNPADSISIYGKRGKEWSIVTKANTRDFHFITVVFPFEVYSQLPVQKENRLFLGDWTTNSSEWNSKGNASISLSRDSEHYFFIADEISKAQVSLMFNEASDFYLAENENAIVLKSLMGKPIEMILVDDLKKTRTKVTLQPGKSKEIPIRSLDTKRE